MSGENAAISVNECKLAIFNLTAFCFVAQLPNRFNNMEHAACRPGMTIAHQAAVSIAGKATADFEGAVKAGGTGLATFKKAD